MEHAVNVTITSWPSQDRGPEVVELIDTLEEHIILTVGDEVRIETESLEVDAALLERPTTGEVLMVQWRDSITLFPEYVSEHLGGY